MVRDMEMLEEGMRERVTAAIGRANSSGQDVAEYLNRYGLLATPQWKRQLQAEMVNFVADAISRTPAWLSGPAAVAAIVKQLRELANNILEGKWAER